MVQNDNTTPPPPLSFCGMTWTFHPVGGWEGWGENIHLDSYMVDIFQLVNLDINSEGS